MDIFENNLVSKHEVLNDEEKAKLLEMYNIGIKKLPRINESDPAVVAINAKSGDILKIHRSEDYFYYRVVR